MPAEQVVIALAALTRSQDLSITSRPPQDCLERHEIDYARITLNAADAGMTRTDSHVIREAWRKVCRRIGKRTSESLPLKMFGQDHLIRKAPIATLIRYTLTLPLFTALPRMPKLDCIEEDIRTANVFQPLSKPQIIQIGGRLAQVHKLVLDGPCRTM